MQQLSCKRLDAAGLMQQLSCKRLDAAGLMQQLSCKREWYSSLAGVNRSSLLENRAGFFLYLEILIKKMARIDI